MVRFGKRTGIFLSQLLCSVLYLEAQALPNPIVKIPFPAGTLCWNTDGTRFAFAEDNIIFVRDARTSELTHTLPLKNVMLLAFSNEGGTDMLLALSQDGTVCLWDFDDDASSPINGGGVQK